MGHLVSIGGCKSPWRAPLGECRYILVILMAAMAVAPGWAQVDSATNRGDATEGLPVPEALRDIGSLTPGMTLAEWRKVAREATEVERWVDAIRILVEVDRRQPEDLDTLTRLAFAYGRYADEKRKDPNDPEGDRKANALIAEAVAVYMRAVPIAAAADAMFAEKILDQVLRYQSKNPEALLMLARLQANTMRGLVAIEQYKRYVATKAGEEDPEAYLEMGRLYRALKYLNHAIDALQKAKKFDPQNDKILAELALAYMDNKAYDDATKLIEEAIRRSPTKVPEYRYIRSLVLTATKQLRGAITAAGDAI